MVDMLDAAVAKTLANLEIAARFEDQGGTPVLGFSAEFCGFLSTFTDKWTGVTTAP